MINDNYIAIEKEMEVATLEDVKDFGMEELYIEDPEMFDAIPSSFLKHE